jgi:deoxycytidylate deaminase
MVEKDKPDWGSEFQSRMLALRGSEPSNQRIIMLKLARKLTKKSKHKFAFHACIVQRGGAIVATGYNHGKIHAETNALNQLWPSERDGCKVWSFRVTRGGRLAMAKPCTRCEAYLRENGIKAVYYSNDTGEIERMKL